jgi:hypothetical protein
LLLQPAPQVLGLEVRCLPQAHAAHFTFEAPGGLLQTGPAPVFLIFSAISLYVGITLKKLKAFPLEFCPRSLASRNQNTIF